MRILLLVCLMVGVAQAETPTQVAKKLLDAQLAAMKGAQSSTFETAFPADTVVGATDGGTSKVADGLGMVRSGIANNMLAVISTTKVLSLTAGGDAKVVWFSGEVEIGTEQQTGPRSITKNKHVVRFTELAVADGAKWKVVAVEFGRPGTPPRDDYGSSIQGETKRGTMTKFLLDPKQMAFQLDAKDATAVVFGTDKGEKAVGYAAAKKLLESWKGLKLEIDGDVREVEGSSWGFVHANVKWLKPGGPPYRMRALAIATKEPSQPWVFRAIQFAVP